MDIRKHFENQVGTEKRAKLILGGESVWVRAFFVFERDWFVNQGTQAFRKGDAIPENLTAEVVQRCVINEDGTQVFTDKDNDIKLIEKLPPDFVDPILQEVLSLSGLDETPQKKTNRSQKK